jgi:hypothetical protein
MSQFWSALCFKLIKENRELRTQVQTLAKIVSDGHTELSLPTIRELRQ